MEKPFLGSRILVVDDEKKACANLRKFLEKKQFEVGIAHNGLEALDLLEEFQPDCILLDIRMPDLNGVECLKRIKSRLPDAQILMVTAMTNLDLAEKCLQEGAHDLVEKPVNFQNLYEKIIDALSARQEKR